MNITERLEENMLAYMAYLPDRCTEMEAVRLPYALLINGGVPSATFNFICKARLESENASMQIGAATEYFLKQGLPVGWWTGPSCKPTEVGTWLAKAGFQHGGVYPGMSVGLEEYAKPPLHQDDSIKVAQVTNPDDISHFAHIAGTAFDGEPKPAVDYYGRTVDVLLQPDCPFRLYLAFLNGDPVATCATFISHGVVGIYSVATLPNARKRGIGRLLTAFALHQGHQLGASYGILQASSQGVRMYQALGFERCCDFDVWLPPSIRHETEDPLPCSLERPK